MKITFANSRKQYLPHKQQQRQAPLLAPASLYVEHFSKALKTKDKTPRKAPWQRKSKADSIFCPQGLTPTLVSLISIFAGFCLWAPSLTQALKSDAQQFGGLNKSCSVETLENDNYSRQSVPDTLCHQNYHNKSWFSKGPF